MGAKPDRSRVVIIAKSLSDRARVSGREAGVTAAGALF